MCKMFASLYLVLRACQTALWPAVAKRYICTRSESRRDTTARNHTTGWRKRRKTTWGTWGDRDMNLPYLAGYMTVTTNYRYFYNA
jgi:hypothetical protein